VSQSASITQSALFSSYSAWSLAALYARDPEAVRSAATLIALHCLFMPCWGAAFVLPQGLRGAGDTLYTMAASCWAGCWATCWAGLGCGGRVAGHVRRLGLPGLAVLASDYRQRLDAPPPPALKTMRTCLGAPPPVGAQ
jgi:hypothetical protein